MSGKKHVISKWLETDQYLIELIVENNDKNAAELLIGRYYKYVYKEIYIKTSDRELAMDLTQETFVNFFAKLSDYHFRGKTQNYLYTIAGNLCKNYYKKKKDLLIEEDELDSNAVSNDMEQVLDKILIDHAIQSLSEELREVVMLYYFQELKISEIASTLQIGVSLVKYRLTQARKQLECFFREEAAHEVGRKN